MSRFLQHQIAQVAIRALVRLAVRQRQNLLHQTAQAGIHVRAQAVIKHRRYQRLVLAQVALQVSMLHNVKKQLRTGLLTLALIILNGTHFGGSVEVLYMLTQ